MKIERIVYFLLFFAVCCGAAFAQVEKTGDSSFYETRIEFSQSERAAGLSAELFLKILLTRAGAPAGIAWVEDEQIDEKFELQSQVLTLKEWLDFFVKTKPAYRWTENDGVINILPVENYEIIETRIPAFSVVNQYSGEIAEKLTETREFEEYLKKRNGAIGLKNSGERYGLGVRRIDGGPGSPQKMSLELKNETFREILNETVRRAGKRLWVYYEYQTEENYRTYKLRIL